MRYLMMLLMLLLSADIASAEKQNFFIITGPQVIEENFQRFVFYFSMDQGAADKLFVRVFDADFGGALDMDYADSTVRYLIYGGANIKQNLRSIQDPLPRTAPLAALELRESLFYDNRWRSIAALNPADGQLADGRILFQLVVDGLSGPGSNKFQLFISADDKKNRAVPSLRLYAPAVNVQVPDAPSLATEIRFTAPDSRSFKITNFDADAVNFGGTIHFSSQLRPKVPLQSSEDKSMDFSAIKLLDQEKGQPAAVLLSSTKVNYVQLWLEDAQGREIPLELPPLLAPANHIPKPKVKVTPLSACTKAVLDASGTVDQDDDQLRFTWHFADGSQAEGSRVTYDFQQPGEYAVQLIVQDHSGFVADQASLKVPVLINAPPKAHILAPAAAAPKEKVRFDGSASTDADGKIVRYRWIFDTDREDNGPIIKYAFARPGLYPVRLLVTDDGPGLCTTAQAKHSILINAEPLAKFTCKRVAAPGEEVILDASQSLDSDGRLTAYYWDFGEQGEPGRGKTVKHVWKQPGLYTVRLQVKDDSGLSNSTDEVLGTIRINAAPEPVITSSVSVAAAEALISFSAAKSHDADGKICTYNWDFGDGTTGQGRRINHAYKQPGRYTVRLTVADDSGVSNASQFTEQTVRINAPPVPVITMPEIVNTSQVVFDASKSSDADDKIIAYRWDFGDGGTAQGRKVEHVYPLPGTYTVQLQVTDASGSASATQSAQQEIRVNTPPVADAGPDQLIAPGGTVQFDGSRSLDPDGTISSFTWQVQDQRYTARKCTHQFALPGQYQVGLTVQDNDGTRHSDYLTVTVNSQPLARMQALPRLEPGKEVLFDASGSTDADGDISTYRWDFGDGGRAEGRQVKHVYAKPGRYQVVLTVQDDSGADNNTAAARQTAAVNFPPEAAAGKDLRTCEQFVSFDGSASTDPDQDLLAYHWDFGDQQSGQGVTVGHQFAAPGLYPVRLRVDDQTGLGNSSDSQQITVQINKPPQAVLRTDSELFCAGEHVLFDASLSQDPEGGPLRYLWDLGDGQQVEGANPVRVYDKAGVYPITLTVLDDSGLQCNAGQARKNIQLIAAPVAKAGEDIETCSNAPAAFDGSASTGGERPIISYRWNFGDGSSDGTAKTTHIYKEPGLYVATLTVKTPELSRCDNQAEDRRKVRVLAAPQAEFKASDGCVGEMLRFDAAESAAANGQSARYSWDFGDGYRGSGVSARHSYDQAGHYTVRLKVDTPENSVCSSSEKSRKIKINQPPVPRIRWKVAGKSMNFERPQAVLPNTVLHFSAAESMDKDGAISTVRWDFGDGQQAEGWFVKHSYKKPGQYAVRLTVADDNADLACGTAQTELPVVVVGQPSWQIQGPKQVCINQEVRYALRGKAEQVRWDFGNGQQRQSREVRVRFSQAGKRTLHTLVDGQPGPVVTVQALALPELALPEYLTVLVGETVRIRPLVVRETGLQPLFSWDAGDGATMAGRTFRHSYSKPGDYTVRLRSSGGPEQPACLVSEKTVAVTVLPAPKARIFHEPEQIFSGGARDETLFYTELFNSQGNWICRWDFGDGSTTEGAVVSHSFQQPGTYKVTLTLLDGSGIARKPYQFSKKIVVQSHEKD